MSTKLLENVFSLKDNLSSEFYDGIKCPCNLKIGTEIEKISVMKDTFRSVPYSKVESFLNAFAIEHNWSAIKENAHTLFLQKDGHSISLEPGCQLEISVAPQKDIRALDEFLSDFNAKVSVLGESFGFYTLGYGISPLSTYDDINIIPKNRYALMTEYFADKGDMAYVMMRETAGVQVNLDYFSEDDAISKFRLGMMLAPVISAMFSNSPVRGGQNTGYKSFRAKSWLYTDNDRCGFVSEKLFDSYYTFTFDDYVDALLDVPMIFVVRDGKSYRMGKTFRDYMVTGFATIDDWKLHCNLYFPEVRLKSFLEFRNADSQSPEMTLALNALYKGIFYDKQAIDETYKLLDGLDMAVLTRMRYMAPLLGLDVKVAERKISDIAVDLVAIAKKSLQKQAVFNNSLDESIYLDVLEENITLGKTPCDKLLEVCGDDVAKIVAYTRI